MSTNEFIRHMDREIDGDEDPSSVREFPSLPGTTAKACLLPDFKSEAAYRNRYGHPFKEDPRNLAALSEMAQAGEQVLAEFEAFAGDHVGQDVLNAAEATLRTIGRLEKRMEPVFAGLTMPTFGLARSFCIGLRARVGDILDQKVLIGELEV